MTTLRVILDQLAAPVPGGIGRYTRELTRALIATQPRGCSVTGWVPASPESVYREIETSLPGLAELEKSVFDRRQIAAAWQHGFTRLGARSTTHAPSLLAPLFRHDRVNNPGDQIVVTIHDAVPWTHPETLTPRGVSWHRAMAARAERYADAVVVPTHAVAEALLDVLDLGDRVRIIAGAVSTDLVVPADAAQLRRDLELPERYVVAVGTVEPRKGLDDLVRALALLDRDDLPLVHVGPQGWGDLDLGVLADEAGLGRDRVRALGFLDDAQVAAVMHGAAVFVMPSRAEGFGLPLLEAMSLGAPTIHTDVPALVEVAGSAGLAVELDPVEGLPERLAEAIRSVVDDEALAETLRVAGHDRVGAFSWRDSAEKSWQLHADL
jgi:glycosyltransferase involved in cell wall biosynthesis